MQYVKVIVLAIVLCVVTSCASFISTVERHKGLVRLGVTLTVQRFVQEKPEYAKVMVQIAHRSKVLLDTSSINVMQVLPFAVQEIIDAGLPSDVQRSLEIVAVVVTEEVQGYVDRVKIPNTEVTKLMSEVLKWIEEAVL